ncbi:MAG: hypothetical protein M0D55_15705 [Elusimicrobiota bacterium]|nr:MAG: hypothetical protein M0D55_15705 [Elusimicrobiota bacterium]
MNPRRRLVLVLAAAAAFAAWTPSLSGSFLKDDESNFVANPAVHDPSRWHEFFWRKASNSRDKELTVAYRPLATLSYAAQARAVGLNPFFFHLADAAGHAANAALVLLLAWELTGSLPAAAAGAVLFALHPVQAESVAYVSGARPSVWSTFFCLLALLARTRGRRGLSLGLFAAGALFKESALALPLALAAWDRALTKKSLRVMARDLWPYFALAAAVAATRSVVLVRTTDSGLFGGTLASHAFFALTGLFTQVRSLLCPERLSLYYTLPVPPDRGPALWGGVALAAVAGALAWGAVRRRAWLAGLGWFCAFLLPTSNLVIPVATLANDRYLYSALAGLALLAAHAAARLPRRWAWAPAAALAAWLLPLAAARQADWGSDFTIDLASHAARPDAAASAVLAIDYFNWGMDARADELVREGSPAGPRRRCAPTSAPSPPTSSARESR